MHFFLLVCSLIAIVLSVILNIYDQGDKGVMNTVVMGTLDDDMTSSGSSMGDLKDIMMLASDEHAAANMTMDQSHNESSFKASNPLLEGYRD